MICHKSWNNGQNIHTFNTQAAVPCPSPTSMIIPVSARVQRNLRHIVRDLAIPSRSPAGALGTVDGRYCRCTVYRDFAGTFKILDQSLLNESEASYSYQYGQRRRAPRAFGRAQGDTASFWTKRLTHKHGIALLQVVQESSPNDGRTVDKPGCCK